MPKRHPPLSHSHNPFVRSAALGPGPRRRKLTEEHDWKCKKGKKKYEQLCKYVGPDESMRGKVKRIIRKKAAKAKYNAIYTDWLDSHGPRFQNVRRSRRGRRS